MSPPASHSAPRPAAAGPSMSAKSTADPILRNALRYTISAREYALLHRYVLSRSRLLKRRAPAVETVQRLMDGRPRSSSRAVAAPGESGQSKAEDRSQASSAATASKVRAADLGSDAGGDDYNARAIRHSLRVFVATGAAMKLWSLLSSRLTAKKQE